MQPDVVLRALISLRIMVNAMHDGRKLLADFLESEEGENDPVARMLSDLASVVDRTIADHISYSQAAQVSRAVEAIDLRADGWFQAGWMAGMQRAADLVANASSVDGDIRRQIMGALSWEVTFNQPQPSKPAQDALMSMAEEINACASDALEKLKAGDFTGARTDLKAVLDYVQEAMVIHSDDKDED